MILNETQTAIRDAVRDFAQSEIRPRTRDFEAAGGYPPDMFRQLAALGLFGMTAPSEYGGAEADTVSYALALIEIAAADGALCTILSIQNSLIVGAILANGSIEQKRKFLPLLISGEMIGAFALTETDAGSDASGMRTLATRATC